MLIAIRKRQATFEEPLCSSKLAKSDSETSAVADKENVPSSSKGKGKSKAKSKASSSPKRKTCQPRTVDRRLRSLKINPEEVSKCVKAAMCKGHIIFNGDKKDLDQLIIEDYYNGHHYKVLLKDVLYQGDIGDDYECFSEGASATGECHKGDEWTYKAYVTRLCEGEPQLDNGKAHNHCTRCKGFGECTGDYRTGHCRECGNHYWFECDYCERQQEREEFGFSTSDFLDEVAIEITEMLLKKG